MTPQKEFHIGFCQVEEKYGSAFMAGVLDDLIKTMSDREAKNTSLQSQHKLR